MSIVFRLVVRFGLEGTTESKIAAEIILAEIILNLRMKK